MAENTIKDVKIQRKGFWKIHLYPELGCRKDLLCVDELNANKRNNLHFCDFVIWSSRRMIVEIIWPDVQFFKDLCSSLINLYHNILLPEYIKMKIPRRLMPVDLNI
ncbi:hypothetical protein ACJMK2_006581 [Sinanodonta woodiana]|uniref:Uncharacterized protein n=1 Tax=Sinanodonta woodiana TaxID=1069815 RepID=A0ABD3VWE0_SINWO